jgi:hypothetical protein
VHLGNQDAPAFFDSGGNMQQVYGPITGFTVAVAISIFAQVVKQLAPNLSDRLTQFVVLGISIIFVVPFELFTIWPDITPISVYNAFFYSFLGWFSAMGIYNAAKVQFARGG